MRLKVYSIYDSVARMYDRPMCFRNDEEAKRSFIDLVENDQTVLARHPSNFSLVSIGEFDDSDASLRPQDNVYTVMTAIEVAGAKAAEEQLIKEHVEDA